jgi:hypothetical protein
MKELRADTKDELLRIAYAFDPTRTAILLIGGNKLGSGKTPFYRQLIARADAIYESHLREINSAKRRKER